MRKTKTVKIDDRKIEVKELRVKDIRKILETAERVEDDDFLKQAEDLLPEVFTGLTLAEIEDMAPSELRMLWEAFKEVNADFLSVIERLGIEKTLRELIEKHLTESLADLSSGDTPGSGNTDGDSS